jgi:hypothetical protein
MNESKADKIAPFSGNASANLAPQLSEVDVRHAKRWLTEFYRECDPHTPDDDTGTTFGCMGAVLLAIALIGSKSPALIAKITDLPQPFVFAICLEMTPCWSLLVDLEATLKESSDDVEIVNDALYSTSEQAWEWVYVGPRSVVYLNLLRNRTLVGGKRQDWFDTEFYEEWDFGTDRWESQP